MISFSQVRTFDLIFYVRSNVLSALLVIFEIIVSTSIAYFINIWTLKKLTPTIVTFFYLQPIVTSIGEFVFYNREPKLESILIFIGILFGGFLVLSSNNIKEKNFFRYNTNLSSNSRLKIPLFK